MDRPIDADILRRRRKRLYYKIAAVLASLFALYAFLPMWLSPSIRRTNIRTGFVSRGSIEGAVSATGTVVPLYEQAIASAGETRILSVRKKPGEFIRRGESILEVDRSEVALQLSKSEKNLALAANHSTQLKLDMERTLKDDEGQYSIKDLRLSYLHSKTLQGEKMFTLGAISKDQLDQTRLEEHIASIEQEGLRQTIQNKRASLENQLEGLTMEVESLKKDLAETRRQYDLLLCRPEHDGVVTWVNDKVGTSIHRGDVMARVADLRSYGVEATLSDIHISQMQTGMPARIRLNDITLTGRVRTVYPAAENGTARVAIDLDNDSSHALRPNLRVDVALVTRRSDSTLVVQNGPFASGDGDQEVFVIHGTKAERTTVRLGVSNFDQVEILSGLAPGDEIILSDMTEYRHLRRISLN
jgi:HlyD family secretion protein